MESKRKIWKIVVGGILVFVSVSNLPLYSGGSTQANTGLALSGITFIGGLYLIYSGFFSSK